jgi:hypothetical protein
MGEGMKDKGVRAQEVDEGCSRVMEDRAKWMEGKKGINRARSLHHGSNAKSTAEESSYL